MSERRVVLLYIHERSGHHQAAWALKKALEPEAPGIRCFVVDFVRYAHPVLEKFFQCAYLQLVKKRPEIWEYLYDNPRIFRGTRKFREFLQRSHSKKLEKLLLDFSPTDIVCTQAFPAAVLSEFKKSHEIKAPLYAVLTDFYPHSYWPQESVERYFVPSRESKEKLIVDGFPEERVRVSGIPIDCPKSFVRDESFDSDVPQVLLMGGSQGLGPLDRILWALDRLKEDFGIIVLTGLNKGLFKKLSRLKGKLKKRTRIISFTEDIAPYFRAATLLITKPGGLTVAQALVFGTPMIFIEPIPGQEARNADFLLSHGAALEAGSEKEAASQAGLLLRSPARLVALKKNMAALAQPDAARQIALEILSGARPRLPDGGRDS